MIYERIGKRIQKAREEAGLSQDQLAINVSLTQAALSNYELGKRRPSLGNLERIATSLGKPLSYFLEESRAVERKEDEHQDETIREMIDLWYDMPEDERRYLLDFFRWRRDLSKHNRRE